MVENNEHYCTPIADETEFAGEIVKAIEQGYAFVPFVGAGFSVAAGIPATPAMFRYLEYCMLSVFGLVPERRKNPWAPRQEPWPTLASWRDNELPTSGRIRQIWQQSLSDNSTELRLREAFGALADWRSALRFFSRIVSVVPSRLEGKPAGVHLGASDPSIIDSFFRALMENRRPALSHKMLHALSTALRCDVLLTTNFDDLIEKAFLDAGSPLSVYEVPSHDPLPTAGLVLRERTLIKLHGGKFWLRADDTLDESPSREDVRNFLGYLAGRPLRSNPQAVGDDLTIATESTALLVCGLSANDQRIKHLLAYALAWMSELTVFWLGYAESDERAANEVAKLACEYGKKRTELNPALPTSRFSPEAMRKRVRVHLCPDIGLFCLRLFQELAHSLPPSGAIFPSLWKLSSPPDFFSPRDFDKGKLSEVAGMSEPLNSPADRFADQLLRLRSHIHHKFRAYAHGDLHASLSPVLVEVEKGCSGGLSLARELHQDGKWGQSESSTSSNGFPDPVHAIWFDLVDVVQPAGFFLRLSLIIASACGESDPISRLNIEDYYGSQEQYEKFCESIAHNIARLTRESGAMWLVTVNAKESPGCNSLFHHEGIFVPKRRQGQSGVNRWQDPEYSVFAARFADTIHYLAERQRLPIQFVFVSHSANLTDKDSQSHICLQALWTRFALRQHQAWVIRENLLDLPSVETLVNRAISRIESKFVKADSKPALEQLAIFRYMIAYSIAIFRIARYPVALREILVRLNHHLEKTEFGASGLSHKVGNVHEFLNRELDVYLGDPRRVDGKGGGLGLVRRKQGGFLWMHLDERQTLLRELHQMLQNMDDGPRKQALAELTLRLHWYVARWYGRLLLSSLDPLAVSQAVDHIFRGLEFASAFRKDLFADPGRKLWHLPVVMVRHACHLLSVAEPLFGRRLSDQFANLAIESLLKHGLATVQKLFDGLSAERKLKSLAAGVCTELLRIEVQLLQMYTTLQRRSGRFDELLGTKGMENIHTRLGTMQARMSTLFPPDPPATSPSTTSPSSTEQSEAIRSGLLGIELDLANCLLCSRRYDQATLSIFDILTSIIQNSHLKKQLKNRPNDPMASVSLIDAIRDWSVATAESGRRPLEDTIAKSIQSLEMLMYLEMHRSQSTYLAREAVRRLLRDRKNSSHEQTHDMLYRQLSETVLKKARERHSTGVKFGSDSKKMRCKLLQNALMWGETGLALLRHLSITDGQKVYVDNVRLRTHSALCEALLASHGSSDEARERIIKAKRLLAEAQAYLDEFPLKHSGKLKAVFELRCAEISILEANVARCAAEAAAANPANPNSPRNSSPRVQDPYRVVLAHVYDSLRAVKRAEVVLEDHRKSRWWWWILLVLKIKACEYLYDVRLRRLRDWKPSTRRKRKLGKNNDSAPPELMEMTRQLPPFALHFLRDELHMKVLDAQMVDPMFLARIVHSFRMICRHDKEFEEELLAQWTSVGGGALPGGRSDRPRVRLGHARSTLRRLTDRLESIVPLKSADTDADLTNDKLDADTIDYARIVILQSKWDVEHDVFWNR